MDRVGVVGAGVMGVGVAQNLAATGHEVVLVDLGNEQLDQAHAAIHQNLRMRGFFTKSKEPKEESDVVLRRINFTTDYDQFSQTDFVIENVVEKWEVKAEVYRRLDAVCPEHCVFAANTSAISITRIGSATRRPDRVLGMHFMNPVPLKSMVEVIKGYHTSQETLDRAEALLAAMGKECIVVNDMPGFVSNRVLMLTVNEAIFVVQDQVTTAENVDRIFKSCFGHTMGPLETGDLIGLDTILLSLEVLYEAYNDTKYRPCPLLQEDGQCRITRSQKRPGFYNYQA